VNRSRTAFSCVVLVALLTACSGGEERAVDPEEPAPPAVSRHVNGDCFEAWNATGNVGNRIVVARDYSGWSLEVSDVHVSHPVGKPATPGCSYFFHSRAHWTSFSGVWEPDGDFVWAASRLSGGRSAEQTIRLPNAVVLAQGEIAPMPSRDGVASRESRAVIDDWYEDGRIDGVHTCAAVKHALGQLPQDLRDFSTVHPDLRDYAARVC
jgi:hypothetical protein